MNLEIGKLYQVINDISFITDINEQLINKRYITVPMNTILTFLKKEITKDGARHYFLYGEIIINRLLPSNCGHWFKEVEA